MTKKPNEIKTYYPSKKWSEIEDIFFKFGSREYSAEDVKNIDFILALGLVDQNHQLTNIGKVYFEENFIKKNTENANRIIFNALLELPSVMAIQQFLYGIKNSTLEQIISTMKYSNLWQNDINLTYFLEILNRFDVITYNRKGKTIKVLAAPDTSIIPQSIYISPDRPYSNIMWTKKVIQNCKNYIYWLDKHFKKEALEWIYSSADANKIEEIKIISLCLPDDHKNAKKEYKRLKIELANRGINMEWRIIKSNDIKDSHDRWIISSNEARNIPDVNTISSGKLSEINLSENRQKLTEAFLKYWDKAVEI